MYCSLVTGGAGFIGSHVAQNLIRNGHKVIILDNLSGGFKDNVPEGVALIQGSVTDKSLVERIFGEHRIDYVYHLAAYAAENLSHFIRRYNYETNLIGSINLINASILHEVKCFVFTSSIAVYGRNQLPMTEEIVPIPIDPYGVSKLAVEQDLRAAHDIFGLPHIVFRPHNVYGEGQNIADKYRNVIGIFMNSILQNKPMPVFGTGLQTRAFSYIGDMAPIIAGAVRNERAYNHVFNIGADEVCSVKALAGMVARAMGVESQIQYLPARDEVEHAYPSHEKIARIFGLAKTTALEEGLKRMAAWAKRVGARKSRDFEGIEIRKNLPSAWAK
jgi:UDP-glucose 4-epimerase